MLPWTGGCQCGALGTGTAAEIEEERSLLYVAMTRARDELHQERLALAGFPERRQFTMMVEGTRFS
jgi:hypothetical protein